MLLFSSCAESQIPKNDDTILLNQSDKIIKLNNSSDWQEIKALWQELNNVPPTSFSSNNSPLDKNAVSYQFSSNINISTSDSLNNILDEQIQKIELLNLLTEDELFAVNCCFKNEFLFCTQ